VCALESQTFAPFDTLSVAQSNEYDCHATKELSQGLNTETDFSFLRCEEEENGNIKRNFMP
jgi:hypothetical protein